MAERNNINTLNVASDSPEHLRDALAVVQRVALIKHGGQFPAAQFRVTIDGKPIEAVSLDSENGSYIINLTSKGE